MASGVVTLKQLLRPNKELILAGKAAPHGRPRRETITTPEQTLRRSEEMLPGSSEPVVHIFGDKNEPLTFHGRWRDRYSGNGFAMAKHKEFASFFSDQVPVELNWDDNIHVECLLVRYSPKIEGATEVAWEFECTVLRNLLQIEPRRVVEVKGPGDITSQIIKSLKVKDRLPLEPKALKGSVVDVLNQLVGDVNSATATLVKAADDIDSFVSSSFTALRRFRAGLGQVRVAVSTLSATYDNLVNTAALENDSANQSQQFWDLQAAWRASSFEAIRQLAIAERESAKAEQGKLLALHEASIGETWQSIAIRWYKTADRADAIRLANGVEVGTEPVPGVIYVVPK